MSSSHDITSHLVLIGDSIFDNAAYVPGEPPVINQVRALLERAAQATLLAVDGDTTRGVPDQLKALPLDTSHIVISCGGNDALQQLGRFSDPADTVMSALHTLAELRQVFHRDYRRMLDGVLAFGKPTAVCTIYDAVPNLGEPLKAALCLFNDVIVREAHRSGLAIIDLRIVCDQVADYSAISPIEPSSDGGWKIAKAIVKWYSSIEAQSYSAETPVNNR